MFCNTVANSFLLHGRSGHENFASKASLSQTLLRSLIFEKCRFLSTLGLDFLGLDSKSSIFYLNKSINDDLFTQNSCGGLRPVSSYAEFFRMRKRGISH